MAGHPAVQCASVLTSMKRVFGLSSGALKQLCQAAWLYLLLSIQVQ
jgi:hypothetical protein